MIKPRAEQAIPGRNGEELPPAIRRSFPRTWYFPKSHLLVWYPRGVLNAVFVDQVLDFIELEEQIQDAPFDRYVDFSGLTDIRLKLDHVLKVARRRRKVRQPVKSAILAQTPIGYAIAQMYEHLMEEGMIEVHAFDRRSEAAEWLDVPAIFLREPS